MVTLKDLKNYVLIVREEEMNNNYRLSDFQIELIKKVNHEIKNDPNLKQQLDQMLMARSNAEMNYIHSNKGELSDEIIDLTPIEEVKEAKKDKTMILSMPKKRNQKKAGYVDALVMALVTGFVGGIATSILIILM